MKSTNRLSIILNAIFWAVMGLVTLLLATSNEVQYRPSDYFYNMGLPIFMNIVVFYVNYSILIPELIRKRKKYAWYALSFVATIVVFTAIKLGIALLNPENMLQIMVNGKVRALGLGFFVINNFFAIGFFLVISSIIKFIVYWYDNEKKQKELEREKKDMELQFLKSQLNPHFLFNSLNNIYSLAYQKSDKTADAILKLSEIMRYMIYESNDSWVSLDKEVEYLQNFIELQKLRFKDKAAVELAIKGEIDGQHIVPLILIAFVENAFKHGVANDATNPIKINLIANKEILHFTVSNKKQKANKDAIGGVGLGNVERRLQLLYPEQYKLNIINTEDYYTTELILDL